MKKSFINGYFQPSTKKVKNDTLPAKLLPNLINLYKTAVSKCQKTFGQDV